MMTLCSLIVVCFAATMPFSAGARDSSYTVTGHLRGADDGHVLIQEYRGKGIYVSLDSAQIENGIFRLEGRVSYPRQVILGSSLHRSKMAFWLENSDIEIHGHVDSLHIAKVAGSASQRAYRASREFLQPHLQKYREVNRQAGMLKQQGDTAAVYKMEARLDSVYASRIEAVKAYIANHSSSYVAADMIGSISYFMDWKELKETLSLLASEVRASGAVSDLVERVEALERVAVGRKVPNFTMHNTEGQPVALYERLQDCELLLIDFWASWCGPCRAENPNLKAAYDTFRDRGFDILGVSLDDNRQAWLNAIRQDELPWIQVSRLQGWDDPVVDRYAVSAIPANFLVRGDGTIVARNLRGRHVQEKIRQFLTNEH